MKSVFALLVAFCVLLSVTGCDASDKTAPINGNATSTFDINSTSNTQNAIDEAKAAITRGEYLVAYERLSDLDSDEANALREKFAFVLVKKYEPKTYEHVTNRLEWVTTEYTYNDNGDCIGYLFSDDRGMFGYGTRIIDENGCCTENHEVVIADMQGKKTDFSGDCYRRDTFYHFDDQGQFSCIEFYEDTPFDILEDDIAVAFVFKDGKLIGQTAPGAELTDEDITYIYDVDGTLLKQRRHEQIIDYEYTDGLCTKQIITTEGLGKHISLFEYENGRMVRAKSDSEDGMSEVVSYVYDKYGNLTSAITTSAYGDQKEETFEWTLKYYENGVPQNVRDFATDERLPTNLFFLIP